MRTLPLVLRPLQKHGSLSVPARNTLTVAFTATIISTVIGTMAALALQRYNFRLRTFSQVSLYIPSLSRGSHGYHDPSDVQPVISFLNSSLHLAGDWQLSLRVVDSDPCPHIVHDSFCNSGCAHACRDWINLMKKRLWTSERTSRQPFSAYLPVIFPAACSQAHCWLLPYRLMTSSSPSLQTAPARPHFRSTSMGFCAV